MIKVANSVVPADDSYTFCFVGLQPRVKLYNEECQKMNGQNKQTLASPVDALRSIKQTVSQTGQNFLLVVTHQPLSEEVIMFIT